MTETIPYFAERGLAEQAVRRILVGEGLAGETTVNGGYGLKFVCRDGQKSFFVTLYFKKNDISSCLVCDKAPESALEKLRFLSRADGQSESASLGASKTDPVGRNQEAPVSGPELRPAGVPENHLGTDESGKGDYFGPLVVAGVHANEESTNGLAELGLKDSKLLTDKTVAVMAERIREVVGADHREVVVFPPEDYNALHQKYGNLNLLLAHGHAQVIKSLLQKAPCRAAVVDQFGPERHLRLALRREGAEIELVQTTKAERYLAVAAASILARDEFVRTLSALGASFGLELDKGASSRVDEQAKKILKKFGLSALKKLAKMHFRNSLKAGLPEGAWLLDDFTLD
ncbi:MAG: ribonuclease HIII [Deltaproteobacteria bacterium]|jgi:ribonuclease HIII|nr:ribonuclease HIII [Deltaproteobacteria bacterium]